MGVSVRGADLPNEYTDRGVRQSAVSDCWMTGGRGAVIGGVDGWRVCFSGAGVEG